MGVIKVYDAELSVSPDATRANVLDASVSRCLKLDYAVELTAVDILPSLKEGDSSCETAMPSRENVTGCIDISVMQRATVGTTPFPYSKTCPTFRTVGGKASATRARLGTVRFVDFCKHH